MFSPLLRCILLIGLIAVANRPHGLAQTPSERLTVEGVVELWKSGVSEDLLITMIRKNGKAFNLGQEEVHELRNVGITETVIKFLIDPSQPPLPAPTQPGSSRPDPPVTSRRYPADPNAAGIPPDAGMYVLSNDVLLRSDTKTLLGETQGAGLGRIIMMKGKVTGYLLGAAARTRSPEPPPALYLRLPEGKGIEEVVLLALDQKRDRRELELGTTPDKLELKSEAMRPFDSVEVGPRLFKVTNIKLTRGEYMFFILGSAEVPKGSYGKGYDFGIERP